MRQQLITIAGVLSDLLDIQSRATGSMVETNLLLAATGKVNKVKKQLLVAPNQFDCPEFAKALRNAIGDRPLREVAVEMQVSVSTVSRLQRGNLPDIETFATVCYWMNTDPSNFFTRKE